MTAERQRASGRRGPGQPRGSVWPRRAEAVARALTLDSLHAGAIAEIRHAAAGGEPVALACSGGADSVALVCTLWAQFPELRGKWLVLHFDHRMRGAASAADARFVAALARGLGETAVIERWGAVDRSHGISEEQAREARFAFFARAMEAHGARVLVLGHQADDVIETMLMRLVRGSGTAGLAAPRPVHRRRDGTVRVRPLLGTEGAELRRLLSRAGVPWREDASNAKDTFLRNRVRRRVLPALRAAAQRELVRGFLASRLYLEDDDAALGAWLAELGGSGPEPDWPALAGRPRALARRAVQAWLAGTGLGGQLARPAVEDLAAAVAAGSRHRLSAGARGFLAFDGRSLRLEVPAGRPEPAWENGFRLPIPGEVRAADGSTLTAVRRRVSAGLRRALRDGRYSPVDTAFVAVTDHELFVRRRQAGDRYRPLGAPGRQRLQDMFVNRKIPRHLRDSLPVVCTGGNQPIWVPGLPPADDMAVGRGTKLVVQLTYTPPGTIVHRP